MRVHMMHAFYNAHIGYKQRYQFVKWDDDNLDDSCKSDLVRWQAGHNDAVCQRTNTQTNQVYN